MAGPAVGVSRRTSRLAIIGLMLSMLAFPVWILVGLPAPLLGFLGVVCGLCALIAIRRNNGRLGGNQEAWSAILFGMAKLLVVLAVVAGRPQGSRFDFL